MNHEKDSWSRTAVLGCNSKKNGSSAISFGFIYIDEDLDSASM